MLLLHISTTFAYSAIPHSLQKLFYNALSLAENYRKGHLYYCLSHRYTYCPLYFTLTNFWKVSSQWSSNTILAANSGGETQLMLVTVCPFHFSVRHWLLVRFKRTIRGQRFDLWPIAKMNFRSCFWRALVRLLLTIRRRGVERVLAKFPSKSKEFENQQRYFRFFLSLSLYQAGRGLPKYQSAVSVQYKSHITATFYCEALSLKMSFSFAIWVLCSLCSISMQAEICCVLLAINESQFGQQLRMLSKFRTGTGVKPSVRANGCSIQFYCSFLGKRGLQGGISLSAVTYSGIFQPLPSGYSPFINVQLDRIVLSQEVEKNQTFLGSYWTEMSPSFTPQFCLKQVPRLQCCRSPMGVINPRSTLVQFPSQRSFLGNSAPCLATPNAKMSLAFSVQRRQTTHNSVLRQFKPIIKL